ncbi:MAG: GNAT family N-acetyltransferase [Devosia sp.]|nr:GNAT family N-acetyltransferase [Devosia sp.]
MLIRPAAADEWPKIWRLLEPVMREGETLALPRDGDEAVGRAYWSSPEKTNFVAIEGDDVLGSSFIRANQQGGGAHVANCGYLTAGAARGRGVARALCAHSIDWCRQAGFHAIQFNFVVSTNGPAVHLWHSFGFDVLARLPKAFEHPRLGYVDALVMWKTL